MLLMTLRPVLRPVRWPLPRGRSAGAGNRRAGSHIHATREQGGETGFERNRLLQHATVLLGIDLFPKNIIC